jgi:hypothetical protein
MSDAPNPNPGWYPDPDLVDTVRYWDGAEWTEHRAPASQTPGGTPPQTTKPSSGGASPEPARNKKKGLSTARKIVFAVSAVVFAIGAALVIKSSLDSNIDAGRELADAMTTSSEEQAAVAEAFGNTPVQDEESKTGSASGCGSPSRDLTEGLWRGELERPELKRGVKTITFEECYLNIPGGMTGWKWESYGDSVAIGDVYTTECVGEVSSDGTSIPLTCTFEFMDETTTYDTELTRG